MDLTLLCSDEEITYSTLHGLATCSPSSKSIGLRVGASDESQCMLQTGNLLER